GGAAEFDEARISHGHNVFRTITSATVLPDDRLQHHDHPWPHDEVLVERIAEVGSNQRHLSTVSAHTMRQIEMLDPRPNTIIGVTSCLTELQTGDPRLENGQAGIDHRPPTTKLPKLHSIRLSADNPGSSIVRRVALPNDARVHPDDIAVTQK